MKRRQSWTKCSQDLGRRGVDMLPGAGALDYIAFLSMLAKELARRKTSLREAFYGNSTPPNLSTQGGTQITDSQESHHDEQVKANDSSKD